MRAAAVALARELERRYPDEITANWWKEERGTPRLRRLQPERAAQDRLRRLVRPAPVGGQVSTPLTWDEVETVVPDELTIRTVPELVRRRGDPWADIGAAPQSIEPLLAWPNATRRPGCTTRRGHRSTPRCPTSRPGWPPSRAKED